MSQYQNKFIPLKEAAIISGYTLAELRNFCKIGLIAHKKEGRRFLVHFGAFEQMNETGDKPVEAKQVHEFPSESRVSQQKAPALKDLVPFTQPHKVLVRILEPVAFAAAIVLSLQLAMTPNIADKVVSTLDLSVSTVEFMTDTFDRAIATSVDLPVVTATKIAQVQTLSADSSTGELLPRVAGASTTTDYGSVLQATEGSSETFLERVLIGIADSADYFDRAINSLGRRVDTVLVGSLQFDNIDSGIQKFFRL